MKRKGQMEFIGILIVAFVAIIVGIAMFQGAAQNVGSSTNLDTLTGYTLTTLVKDTPQYINTYKSISGVTMINATGGATIAAVNYTVTNNVIYNGQLAIKIMPNVNDTAWNISGTVQPLGYISDSGGRGIASIIVIFAALALAVVALVPTLRSGVLDMMK